MSIDVTFGSQGKLSGFTRDARCAGSFADATLNPNAPVSATLRGRAREGVTRCAPRIDAGTLALRAQRLIALDDERAELNAEWAASEPLLTGTGNSRGRAVTLFGSLHFTPAARYGCTGTGFPKAGRLDIEIVLRDNGVQTVPEAEPTGADQGTQRLAPRRKAVRKRASCKRVAKRQKAAKAKKGAKKRPARRCVRKVRKRR